MAEIINSQKHEDQLALKATNKDFLFKFSVSKDNLYINSLSQNIDYGWDIPIDANKDTSAKSVTQGAFNENKTTHEITLNGYIYINTDLGCGIDKFTEFKNICNTEVYWYLMAFRKKKSQDPQTNKITEVTETYQIKGGSKGMWYVKNIRQEASEFITGLNALKISFSITINKYS